MSNSIRAEWWVNRAGYRLVQRGRSARVEECAVSRFNRLDPTATPDLYRRFARIQSTKDVLVFAGAFGLLGLPQLGRRPSALGLEPRGVPPARLLAGDTRSERIVDWLQEAKLMSAAIDVWEAAAGGKERQQSEEHIIRCAWLMFQSSRSPRPAPIDLPPAAVKRQPWNRVQRRSHRWPRPRASQEVLAAAIGDKLHLVGATPEPQLSARGTWEIVFRPPTLLAAIWLQFMMVVTVTKEIRRCLACQEIIPIGWTAGKDYGTARSQRRTCGDSCRKAASRARHDTEVRK